MSARVIEALLHVMRLLAGHEHHVVYWIGCTSHPLLEPARKIARASCAVIRLAPHSARIGW